MTLFCCVTRCTKNLNSVLQTLQVIAHSFYLLVCEHHPRENSKTWLLWLQITEILIDITAGVTNMHIGWGLLQPELRWDERWERLCSHGHDTTTPDHRPMITDHWDTWDGLWNTWDNDGQMSARHDNNTHSPNILVTDPVTQLWVFCASHHNVWKFIQMTNCIHAFLSSAHSTVNAGWAGEKGELYCGTWIINYDFVSLM